MELNKNTKIDLTGMVREIQKTWVFQTEKGESLTSSLSFAIDEILLQNGYDISKDFDRFKITIERI